MKNLPDLVVALDFPDARPALELARRLRGVVPWVKVGLELYLAAGKDMIARLKNMDFRVFLDLKFMDIPNTVDAAVFQAARMGADMLTVHALGGEAMCRAAQAGRDRALLPGRTPPVLLAVTVLTSMGPGSLPWNPGGTAEELHDFTVRLAGLAQNWNLDGVVCSGREVRAIRASCGDGFHLLTPGIRLPDAGAGDQSRVCTPQQAARDGSDFLVVGRPITQAADPVAAARTYLEKRGA